ncbi:MAG TPA: D-glycero-beta-D-manno-heptose 1,7-bisphosphate 7-phosphatase [Gammaproteobacteria bacterium]|nr:D-glycero-beta-D-manno-heptose 1,7-bisphosphate 7-phosphatase [Gammaproteobacteria bacterium]
MAAKAVFIDRDGVINREKEYLHRVEDFEFIDGVFDACRLFREQGYRIIVVTNQSGIGRGYYSEQEYARLTEWMVAQFSGQGVVIDDVLHCPHHPEHGVGEYRVACDCRKPRPGMLLAAAQRHRIDLSQSLMFGDKEADIQAGRAAGVGKTVLVRSGHPIDERATLADHIIDSLGELDAIKRIIEPGFRG